MNIRINIKFQKKILLIYLIKFFDKYLYRLIRNSITFRAIS